jgi:diguanylate cyclase (GGDEF)-like protein
VSDMRVLIADDDVTCRLVLQATVEKLGHECIVASDGEEAWTKFEAAAPDVLITDWMMPGLDGLELCRRVRERLDGGYTYVVLATSLGQHEHVIEGMESGADDYLTKPISPFDLRTRLIAARRVTDLHKQVARFHGELERLNGELALQARTDPLTGLGNRLRLHEDLQALHERSVRYGHPYCIAMCDLDEFKAFNDTYGHLDGDHALRRVGQTLQLNSRGADGAYRYGGEEFVVVLTDTTLTRAMRAMERMRRAVEELSITHEGKDPRGVMTISVGISAWDASGAGAPHELLAAADEALYASKAQGRNRVTAAGLVALDTLRAG